MSQRSVEYRLTRTSEWITSEANLEFEAAKAAAKEVYLQLKAEHPWRHVRVIETPSAKVLGTINRRGYFIRQNNDIYGCTRPEPTG